MIDPSKPISDLTQEELKQFIHTSIKEAYEMLHRDEPKPEQADEMTLEEVAEMLNLRPPTIYGYTSAKKIPHKKVGKFLMFSRSEITEWNRKRTKQRVRNGILKESQMLAERL